MIKTELLQLRITPELKAQLKALAAADGRTMSSYVEQLIKRAIPETAQKEDITMAETYRTLEIASGVYYSLQLARRFTAEEKTHYAEWYRDFGFVGLPGSHIDLDCITLCDDNDILAPITSRKPDGAFKGCSNDAYIISEAEWDALVSRNAARKAEQLAQECKEEREYYEYVLAQCAKQPKLYTREEAAGRAKNYVKLYNEGGEGYVPHFWTVDEYEYAKRKLEELA